METIRPWLHIGKYRDTLNQSLLASYQIGAMLQLAEHVQHPQITTLYLPVEDGVPPNPYGATANPVMHLKRAANRPHIQTAVKRSLYVS